MRFPLAALVAAILTASVVTPALAGPLADGGVTAAEVSKILQDKGYRAELGRAGDGTPKIVTSTEGSTATVFFYTCGKGERCTSIQFFSGFTVDNKLTPAQMNKWNANHRFGRAYLDDEGQANIEMDLDVEHGYTTEAIVNNLDTWNLILSKFKAFLRCSTETAAKDCAA